MRDYIRTLHKLGGDGPSSLRFQIERHRFLVPIHGEKVGALPFHEWRSPAPRLIAAAGLLDFDHACARIAEHLRAERPGQNAGEIDDGDALEGKAAAH